MNIRFFVSYCLLLSVVNMQAVVVTPYGNTRHELNHTKKTEHFGSIVLVVAAATAPFFSNNEKLMSNRLGVQQRSDCLGKKNGKDFSNQSRKCKGLLGFSKKRGSLNQPQPRGH